jgi:ABC-2 type transport system permease protein
MGATIVPTAMLFIFFFVLTMSSGYMLRSVTKEKETNVMEVLLLSLRPRELMVGKILGLGVVALLQMTIWLGGALLVLGEGLPMIRLLTSAAALDLPPQMILWFVLYFLFGYLTFASALGAIGSMAPNTREGSQFTFVIMLPLMIPLWLNTTFTNAPNGTLVTLLSIFPLTAPVSMVARLAATSVPLWQILLSLALSAATTYGFVLLAARFFRADTLLSGASLSWNRIIGQLRGQEAG